MNFRVNGKNIGGDNNTSILERWDDWANNTVNADPRESQQLTRVPRVAPPPPPFIHPSININGLLGISVIVVNPLIRCDYWDKPDTVGAGTQHKRIAFYKIRY